MNQSVVKAKSRLRHNYILRILGYLRPYWRTVLLAVALLVASVAADLTIPTLIQRIIDLGIAPKDIGIIGMTAALMVLIAVLEAIATIGNTFL